MTATPHHPPTDRPDPAEAAELLERGLGRRAFARAALAAGAAAAAGVATAGPAAATPTGRTRLPGQVLQPGEGPIDGEVYLPSQVDQVYWGYLPRVGDAPVARVRSGRTITIDTVSHEGSWRPGPRPGGLVRRQGRPPRPGHVDGRGRLTKAPSVAFRHPFGETPDAWVPIGLSDPDGSRGGQGSDLDVANRRAVLNALDSLQTDRGMDRALPTPTSRRPWTSRSPRWSTARSASTRSSRSATSAEVPARSAHSWSSRA